jgi:amino-acid N-acetyltransferase
MTNSATTGVTLRQASQEDFPAIEQLLRATRLPVEGVKDSLDSFVVAERDDFIVGVAGVERCGLYGLLRSVAVDPQMRGRGIGGALIERLIADSRDKEIPELYLLTTTAEKYFPAFGFTKIDRDATPADVQNTSEFKDLCPSSATVMHRALEQ